jgi:hypothetical protein
MFEDQPAHLLQALRQPLHELERMKLRLVLQFEGALDGERQRHPVAQLVDEPGFSGGKGFVFHFFHLAFLFGKLVGGQPHEVSVQVFLPADLLDAVDGAREGFGHHAGRFLAEAGSNKTVVSVDAGGEVPRTEAGGARADLVGFEQDHLHALFGEQVGGRNAGDAAADDHDVGFEVGFQFGERRGLSRLYPDRGVLGLHVGWV